MKILIRNSDHAVIYAQDDLQLDTEAHGNGWRDPNFNTQNATLGDAELPSGWTGAVWAYHDGAWSVLDADWLAAREAAEADRLAAADAARVAALWQAAHDYEFEQISGSAIGLLAIGVMTAKPKCLAIQAWIKGIWVIYYTRKAGTSHDCDYSGAGECPHSVPEMMLELGV